MYVGPFDVAYEAGAGRLERPKDEVHRQPQLHLACCLETSSIGVLGPLELGHDQTLAHPLRAAEVDFADLVQTGDRVAGGVQCDHDLIRIAVHAARLPAAQRVKVRQLNGLRSINGLRLRVGGVSQRSCGNHGKSDLRKQ